MTPTATAETLSTWNALNAAVMHASEAECLALLEAEKKGKARRMFLLRIHSRLNKIRADRERRELTQDAKTREA